MGERKMRGANAPPKLFLPKNIFSIGFSVEEGQTKNNLGESRKRGVCILSTGSHKSPHLSNLTPPKSKLPDTHGQFALPHPRPYYTSPHF